MSELSGLEQFVHQDYLNLETFRKTGEGVKTPAWFVEDNGKLYVRTVNESAKVKRLRRNPQVNVAPCEVNGKLKGEWVEAEATTVVEPSTARRINRLLRRKYGLKKRMFELQELFGWRKMAVIEITLQI